ncbi:Fic/DOC family protein [Bosea sp. CRIB-10]|uniref:Fic family protein n=1 Tax=Bosea sp. CRIB-10 TaxID=378404 RepID=UPI0008EFCA98|nr:Fic family protein [Bosea sp. CRIB-10]SFD34347.1 Fic/DOC family protein [Bosea sp. CRIB-10]
MADRDSQSGELELVTDPDEKAKLEALNALRQTKAAMDELQDWLGAKPPSLKPSLFLRLHRILMDRISPYPGVFRPGPMSISKSEHTPPPAADVPALIEELCDYVNSHWQSKSALHLASYILWRTNWVHPFADGNGRTARIVSYLILCAHTRTELPGTPTIPEQIAAGKQPYYHALEAADQAFRRGIINVSAIENLLETCLARQLVGFFKTAGGRTDDISDDIRSEIDEAIQAAQREGVLDRDAKPILPSLERRGLVNWIERHPVIVGLIGTLVIAALGWLFGR